MVVPLPTPQLRPQAKLAVVEVAPGVLKLTIRRPGRDKEKWRNVAIANDLRNGSGLAAALPPFEPVGDRPARFPIVSRVA
jgi:hypothetical protein